MPKHLVALLACLITSASGAETSPELRKKVESLPTTLKALHAANSEAFAGSTVSMVEACYSVANGLLPILLDLMASNEEERAKMREEIQRDARGVAADVYYANHAIGWGGTVTRVFAASAHQNHIETRLCYEVTQQFDDDDTFDLRAWHEEWEEAGGSVGDNSFGIDEEEERDTSDLVSIDEGELRFSPGTSGGIYRGSLDTLTRDPITFSAKAGQQIVLAALGIEAKIDRVSKDGEFTPASGWAAAHDLKLPESKGGRYRIHFSGGREESAVTLLVEIR